MRLALHGISREKSVAVILAATRMAVTFFLWTGVGVLKSKAQGVSMARRNLDAWRTMHNISVSDSTVRDENLAGASQGGQKHDRQTPIADILSYTDEATFYDCSIEVNYPSPLILRQ
jgi:hypothetical protein